jgi:hypothetical protein
MSRFLFGAAIAALGLAGCAEDRPAPQDQAQGTELPPGLYEASWTVTELRSTDKTDPATDLAVGSTGTTEACVREGPVFDPALFAVETDQCTPGTSYTRGGRINIQMQCKRAKEDGPVMQTITGTYSAEGFQGDISTSTYFTGYGDYSMMRTVKGVRTVDCPEEGAAGEP